MKITCFKLAVLSLAILHSLGCKPKDRTDEFTGEVLKRMTLLKSNNASRSDQAFREIVELCEKYKHTKLECDVDYILGIANARYARFLDQSGKAAEGARHFAAAYESLRRCKSYQVNSPGDVTQLIDFLDKK